MLNIKKIQLLQVSIIFIVALVVIYVSFGIYNFSIVSKYEDKVYPNVYVNNQEISGINREELSKEIDKIAQKVENKEITFKTPEKEYNYKLKDLKLTINKAELTNEILTYANDLSYLEKAKKISGKTKTEFNYKIVYSKKNLEIFLKELKTRVDSKLVEGKMAVDKDRKVFFDKGLSSFSLDISKTLEYLENNINNITNMNEIVLIGDSVSPKYSNLSTINKKIASYTNQYNNKVSRAKNLANAAKLLNGTIVEPGEVFSFFKTVGPYGSAKGYVYYDGVVGNGVCQVASTIYNVELLSGLKTVERHAHAYQMPYVDGGLDATVASKLNANKLDFKFKNTYKYPIYIAAYADNGKLTIEFWSNENSTEGKTYKTESKKVGNISFNTYLVTYKDGKEINRTFIAKNWYKAAYKSII